MEQPSVQNSIRFLDFTVPSIQMDAISLSKNLDNKFNVNLGFEIVFFEGELRRYSVTFNAAITNDDKTFSLSLVAVAFFESNVDITEEFKNSEFVKINSPAIAFPFVRSFINTLSTNAGFSPIILPSFNFAKLEQPQTNSIPAQ